MVAFNVVFLLVIKLGLFGFFLANTLSLALAVVYFAIRLKIFKLVKFNVKDKALKKEMLKYCVPLITVALSWWVNSSASKYIVSAICGVAANGLLSVAYKIPNIISMIQGLFMQAWQISAIKENKSKDAKKFYSDTFTFMNMALVIACSVFILFNKFIAKILFANEFYGAWEFVPFLMVASVFNAATGYLGPILAAENKTKPMAKSAIYSAIVNIALSAVLVYFMGIQGATIATMIASPVSYFIRHKALGFILNNKVHKCNIISWGLLVLQAVVAIYTDWYIIQAVIIAVMIIVYSKQIKTLIEKGLSVVKNIKK
jgi:O-antigen/teichoic acid export membrane protein